MGELLRGFATSREQILPQRGRGTMRSMVEGHVPVSLRFRWRATPPVPLHHSPRERFPSPFRGGFWKVHS